MRRMRWVLKRRRRERGSDTTDTILGREDGHVECRCSFRPLGVRNGPEHNLDAHTNACQLAGMPLVARRITSHHNSLTGRKEVFSRAFIPWQRTKSTFRLESLLEEVMIRRELGTAVLKSKESFSGSPDQQWEVGCSTS